MADVTQNISAQLFVKELPAAQRADFNGCQQDFRANHFTTCVNNVASDTAVEQAFQKQLSLSEYYKSPEVFNTLKQNYMAKTMEGHFETEQVNPNAPTPQTVPPDGSSAPLNQTVGPRDFIQGGIKNSGLYVERFGEMASNTPTTTWIILIAIIAFIYYKCKK